MRKFVPSSNTNTEKKKHTKTSLALSIEYVSGNSFKYTFNKSPFKHIRWATFCCLFTNQVKARMRNLVHLSPGQKGLAR